MNTLPCGIRCLIISCFDPGETQFGGIADIAGELARRIPRLHALRWQGKTLNRRGESLNLRRRRTLSAVIVSGHGAEYGARLQAAASDFSPGCLLLPPRARLYLLACYQGKAAQLSAWARGTGIALEQVYGHDNETESALSTCLFLHLLSEGPGSLPRRFEQWRDSNNYLRPYFPLLRRLYADCGGDPLCTLRRLGEEIDLKPVADFIGVCHSHPGYLRGLTPQLS